MKLYNNTSNNAFYNISNPTQAECGSISPSQTLDLPGWNNQQNVKVDFVALPPEPDGSAAPFSVTIPQSNTGMTVTIGIYQE